MLSPARGTILGGRLDQRTRCCASSNANSTLCRCFWSSVERKVFAAPTIRGVAVCAMAALSDNRTTPTTVLIDDLPPVCDHGTSKEPLHYCRGSAWLASSIIIPQRWRNNPSRDL